MGEITGAYGVAGTLWVRPLTDVPGRERSLEEVIVVRGDGETPRRVRSAREVDGRWLVSLEGVSAREEAEALVGGRLEVERKASPPLPAGEWYVDDLVGRPVVAEDGRELGRLSGVVRTGANDCWEIAGPDGDLLFPALKGLVLDVPEGNAPIRVRVPPGLLDACLSRKREGK